MKKILLLLSIVTVSFTSQAQKNIFDASLCDANDYLNFNSQAVGDKYIGEGKVFQLFGSAGTVTVPILGESIFDPTLGGAGSTGTGTGGTIGSIKLGFASADKSLDGGSIIMKLPSCSIFLMNLSSFAAMRPTIYTSTDGANWSIQKSYAWNSLTASGGQKLWAIHSDVPAVVSTSQKYVKIVNCAKSFLFIHNVRIMGDVAVSGIAKNEECSLYMMQDGKTISFNEEAQISVFNTDGTCVKTDTNTSMDLNGFAPGCYIVKAISSNGIYSEKIILQ